MGGARRAGAHNRAEGACPRGAYVGVFRLYDGVVRAARLWRNSDVRRRFGDYFQMHFVGVRAAARRGVVFQAKKRKIASTTSIDSRFFAHNM